MTNKVNFRIKESKGITLVALVVTIIVLIILAGVSINLILGENGIIRQAQLASEAYNQAAAKEKEDLLELENMLKLDQEIEEDEEDKEVEEEEVVVEENVNVVLKSSLNHIEDFSGIKITIENKTDGNKTQEYTLNEGENSHEFKVNKDEKYIVKVSDYEDEFYVYDTPLDTEEYTAEAGNTRTIEMMYNETAVYLYKNGKENTKLVGTFICKIVDHKIGYTGTGTYSKNSDHILVTAKKAADILMLTENKIDLSGYTKVITKADITKNANEMYHYLCLFDSIDYEYCNDTIIRIINPKYANTTPGIVDLELLISDTEEAHIGTGIGSAWMAADVELKIMEVKLEV